MINSLQAAYVEESVSVKRETEQLLKMHCRSRKLAIKLRDRLHLTGTRHLSTTSPSLSLFFRWQYPGPASYSGSLISGVLQNSAQADWSRKAIETLVFMSLFNVTLTDAPAKREHIICLLQSSIAHEH